MLERITLIDFSLSEKFFLLLDKYFNSILNEVMAKRIIAGNWKMNLEKKEAIQLAFKLISLSENLSPEIELIIAPPFIHISIVRDIIISKSSPYTFSCTKL